MVAYWSAWLKANHPAHVMASLLTSERDHTVKVVRCISGCKEMGIEVPPPDVNESDVNFTVIGDGAIRFGLSAIKGVGRGAVASIADARQRVGRVKSLHSFCSEIDLRLNNKKVLEAVEKAGALDSLGDGRSTLMFSLDTACDAATSIRADRESGQASLFAGPAEPDAAAAATPAQALPRCPEWTREEWLRHSRQALDDKLEKVGVILSASPGSCPVRFELALADVGLVTLQAAGTWAIDPEPGVVRDLGSVVGKGTVSLTFG